MRPPTGCCRVLSREQTRAYERFLPEALTAAAVLVPLVERAGELSVLLTQRAVELKSHAGQISFPGGRLEANESPLEAALREAREEVGLDRASFRSWAIFRIMCSSAAFA